MATRRNQHHYVKRREALRRRAQAADTPCHLCHKPINWEADYRDPQAFTADHVTAVAAGGSMVGELRPAHRTAPATPGAAKKT